MNVEVIAGRGVDEALAAAWGELPARSPLPESSYLRPEWTRLLAEHRSDVRVIVATGGDGAPRGDPAGADRSSVAFPRTQPPNRCLRKR